jgi:hypothetical protein
MANCKRQISKLDAAKRQLDCAISLLLSKQDSLAIHTLAYAAYRLVHDHHPKNVKAILEEFERTVSFKAIPNFLKHADSDAGAILDDHSLETTWLTIAVAIRLWNELATGNRCDARICQAAQSVQARSPSECSFRVRAAWLDQ